VNKKFIPAEKNLEKLLKNLSADKKPYPKDLLKARRAFYLSQVTSVVSSGPQLTKGAQQGRNGSPPAAAPMTPLMKVVLTVLIAANVALATYLVVSVHENWDTVRELLFETPTVVEASPAPFEIPTQEPASAVTPEFVPSLEGAVVPSATPEPASSPDDSQSSDNSQPSDATLPEGPQAGPSEPEVSTPEPNGKDNPGKHLGQTPHGPGDPPGQDNQESNQDNTQDSDQDNDGDNDKDNDKDKKDKDNNP